MFGPPWTHPQTLIREYLLESYSGGSEEIIYPALTKCGKEMMNSCKISVDYLRGNQSLTGSDRQEPNVKTTHVKRNCGIDPPRDNAEVSIRFVVGVSAEDFTKVFV